MNDVINKNQRVILTLININTNWFNGQWQIECAEKSNEI